jgi:hypothetical protein
LCPDGSFFVCSGRGGDMSRYVGWLGGLDDKHGTVLDDELGYGFSRTLDRLEQLSRSDLARQINKNGSIGARRLG